MICPCRRPASDDGLRYYAVSVSDYWGPKFGATLKHDAFDSQMRSLGYSGSVILNSRALESDVAAIDNELRREILDEALGEYIMSYREV